MKCVLVALALLLAGSAFAQNAYVPPVDDSAKFLIFTGVTAGPFFTGGVSKMNENVTSNWDTDPEFAYQFGAVADLDVMPWLGFQLGLAYDARDLYETTNADSASIDLGVQYVAIQPSIRLFWLLLGVAINIPMSGAATVNVNNFNGAGPYTENRNVANSDIGGTTDLRASLSVPIYKAESGEVHLLAMASYPLSKVLAGTSSLDSVAGAFPKPNLNTVFGHAGEGPLPTVQAGISYQFDLLNLQ